MHISAVIINAKGSLLFSNYGSGADENKTILNDVEQIDPYPVAPSSGWMAHGAMGPCVAGSASSLPQGLWQRTRPSMLGRMSLRKVYSFQRQLGSVLINLMDPSLNIDFIIGKLSLLKN